jgi:hypothetical protein
MAKTRLQMKPQIRANHGSSDTAWKDSVLTNIFTLMLDDLARQHKWKDLQEINSSLSLAIDDYSVALPATVQYVDFIHILDADSNWYRVDLKILPEFRNLEAYRGMPVPPSTAARPENAVLIGRTLYLDAKCDVAYTVYLDDYIFPTAFADDSAVSVITGIDGILEAYGTGLLYIHRKQPQTAKTWLDMAEHFLNNHLRKEGGGKIELNRDPMGI